MKRFAAYLSGWCFIVAALVFSIQLVCFQKGLYHFYYQNSALPEELSVSLPDIEYSMDLMLDYLRGSRSDLEGTIIRDGQEVSVYNEKEKQHMQDVKTLYQNALLSADICLGLFIVISLLLLVFSRKSGLFFIAQGIKEAGLCFLILFVFLAFWASTNFSDFWVQFHRLFFSNDLWLLDPATDFMICICPESLFMLLIVTAALCFFVFFLPVWLLSMLYSAGKAKQE